MKGKMYKMLVRLTMLYGLEIVAQRKRQERQVKMFRFSLRFDKDEYNQE